jgi:p-aminobenzoyl-glutamate transporter AbgT
VDTYITNRFDEVKFGQTEEKTMVRTLAEINADKKALAEEEKKALKAHKKDAVATVKRLIVEYNLTKGDLRGKAMKQLEGE